MRFIIPIHINVYLLYYYNIVVLVRNLLLKVLLFYNTIVSAYLFQLNAINNILYYINGAQNLLYIYNYIFRTIIWF